MNKAKQIRALMPNLIHSMDATTLALLVNLYFDKTSQSVNNFYSIHDCFAVTANNVEKLISIIKIVYINIYSDNSYITKFDKGIIENIKLQFGSHAFNDLNRKIKINDLELDYPDLNKVLLGKIKAENILKSEYIIN